MNIVIPKANTHSDVAKEQHLVPENIYAGNGVIIIQILFIYLIKDKKKKLCNQQM